MLRRLLIPGLILGALGLMAAPVIAGSKHPQAAEGVQIDILSLAVDR